MEADRQADGRDARLLCVLETQTRRDAPLTLSLVSQTDRLHCLHAGYKPSVRRSGLLGLELGLIVLLHSWRSHVMNPDLLSSSLRVPGIT